MNTAIIDFKTPRKLFELEAQSFVVLSFDLYGTTFIDLAVLHFVSKLLHIQKIIFEVGALKTVYCLFTMN